MTCEEGADDLHCDVYVVPVTLPELLEQFLSKASKFVAVEVGDGALRVSDASDELAAASLCSASFALLDTTPVPAASPMTVMDRTAMIIDRMSTSPVHPQKFRFFVGALRVGSPAAVARVLLAVPPYADCWSKYPYVVEPPVV